MPTIEQRNYLKRSIRIFRFYTIASLILILIIMLLSPLRQNYPIGIGTNTITFINCINICSNGSTL